MNGCQRAIDGNIRINCSLTRVSQDNTLDLLLTHSKPARPTNLDARPQVGYGDYMNTPMPLVTEDPGKRKRLDNMKRRATGLLVLAAVIFGAALYGESAYPWLGYVRATAEAAMVGGLADWFAVTALFRHPLGIPIPHTAIIARRKDRIAHSLGNFVERNFFGPAVIAQRLEGLRLAERAARWISEPAHADRLSNSVAHGLAGAAQVLKDKDVQALIDRALISGASKIQVAPLLGGMLALFTENRRHQALLDEGLRALANAVAANEELIRERVRAESPWWIPGKIDNRIHDRIVTGIQHTLEEVGRDPEHPLRLRFDAALERFIEHLKTSPDAAARAASFKEELLAHPVVREFSASLWSDIKRSIIESAERQEQGEGPRAISRGLQSMGRNMLADAALLEKADRWLIGAIADVVAQYRGEVAKLITDTVVGWDAEDTSRKIELQIGRDLQYVRINGTLVGGLVGLVLYSIVQLVG